MFSRGLIQIPNACGCSNPRTQDEEEKTDNVWMKGHAGNYPPIPHLTRASLDTRHRPHEFHGDMESTCHGFANQRLGWSMALCKTFRERSRKSWSTYP